ncbi:MAG: hypothetical protein ACI8RZ_005124, partial [Myxococcota bacterium]
MPTYAEKDGVSAKTISSLKKVKAAKGRVMANFSVAVNPKDKTTLLLGMTMSHNDDDGSKAAKLTNKAKRKQFGLPAAVKLGWGLVLAKDGKLIFHLLQSKGLTTKMLKSGLKAVGNLPDVSSLKTVVIKDSKKEDVIAQFKAAAESGVQVDNTGLSESEQQDLANIIAMQPNIEHQIRKLKAGVLLREAEFNKTCKRMVRDALKAIQTAETGHQRLEAQQQLAMIAQSGGDVPESGKVSGDLAALINYSTWDKDTEPLLALMKEKIVPEEVVVDDSGDDSEEIGDVPDVPDYASMNAADLRASDPGLDPAAFKAAAQQLIDDADDTNDDIDALQVMVWTLRSDEILALGSGHTDFIELASQLAEDMEDDPLATATEELAIKSSQIYLLEQLAPVKALMDDLDGLDLTSPDDAEKVDNILTMIDEIKSNLEYTYESVADPDGEGLNDDRQLIYDRVEASVLSAMTDDGTFMEKLRQAKRKKADLDNPGRMVLLKIKKLATETVDDGTFSDISERYEGLCEDLKAEFYAMSKADTNTATYQLGQVRIRLNEHGSDDFDVFAPDWDLEEAPQDIGELIGTLDDYEVKPSFFDSDVTYEQGVRIGGGANSSVFAVSNINPGGGSGAVKVSKPKEVDLMSRCAGSGVLPILGFKGNGEGVNGNLVMPQVRGSFEDSAEKITADPKAFRHMLRGTIGGVARMHTLGIVHKDLTDENVLIGDDGPLIADFGNASQITSDDVDPFRHDLQNFRTAIVGSMHRYRQNNLAPEEDYWIADAAS